MEIAVSQAQAAVPVAILHVKGEINAETSDQLDAEARRIYQEGTSNLLIDLTQVPYISSYGIRTLSEIFTLLRRGPKESDQALQRGLRDGTFKSGHLKLFNPSQQVRKVLTTAGVDMFLEMYDDLQKAVASFS
jgi:anti-anti-sigma factor